MDRESVKKVLTDSIKSDLHITAIIKFEAEAIEGVATPINNPAASAAQTVIESVGEVTSLYERALEIVADDPQGAVDLFRDAQPHLEKADAFLGKAREFLIDPIYPKKGDHP
ncbi:hypothetical protein [Agrobacterium rosae]|uniref:Uncharacterized protein n=1 Tax=Agrobacterium rosae TaxID=1972867 RepID=A0AAE5RYQ8_9HYPH|nr:hypothetical protein [Agrobacterium rosae]KAA3511590.1 hypothetical protein DXM21_14180 [Agrobacterium rosae]KAA3518986.1 hypothetical protein DXM25_13835 [Agrobacterium rosae]MQB49286.1 hypothetical protein [Agrobacterium rosae]POO51808.1 hypothetical protein CPJ18_09980 [Agrobacterium rosae]